MLGFTLRNVVLHAAGSESSSVFTHAILSSSRHHISAQAFSNINMTLRNGVACRFMNTCNVHSNKRWPGKHFTTPESFSTNGDYFQPAVVANEHPLYVRIFIKA